MSSSRVTKTVSRLLQADQINEVDKLHKRKHFDEDFSDFELSDEDSDFEEDDPERIYTKRAFYEKERKVGETFHHSDDSEESDDSEDEDKMEMEIEMLDEDLKRMKKVFEMHGKTMDENERKDFKQQIDMKKMQQGALEEMLETRYIMENEEMKRAQQMDLLEEDLKEMEDIFEMHGKAMSENEIQNLEQKYELHKRQLMELQEDIMEEEGNVREMERFQGMETLGELGEKGVMEVMEDMDERERMEYMEYLDNMNTMNGMVGDREGSDFEQPVDLLQKHIGDHDLGLVFRPPTRFRSTFRKGK